MLNTSTMATAKKEESSPRVLYVIGHQQNSVYLDTSAHAQTLPSRLDWLYNAITWQQLLLGICKLQVYYKSHSIYLLWGTFPMYFPCRSYHSEYLVWTHSSYDFLIDTSGASCAMLMPLAMFCFHLKSIVKCIVCKNIKREFKHRK